MLANIALHGLETDLKELIRRNGWSSSRRGVGVHVVRYADDFIITCQTKEQAERLIPVVADWLWTHAGVELNREKTRITHIADGFDFLGFNLRKYQDTLLIKPAKASQLAFLRKVKALLDAHRMVSTETLLQLLNPLLRGWASYYRSVVSKQVFTYCDYRLYQMLWRWAKRRHPTKSAHWVKAKYFAQRGRRHWVFTDGQHDLFQLAAVPIIRHVKVQGRRSPYRAADAPYFEHRRTQLLITRWTALQQRVAAKVAAPYVPAPSRNPGLASRTTRVVFGFTK